MLITAIIIVSYLMGFLSLAVMLRHTLRNAASCQVDRKFFWEFLEKHYKGIFKGEIEKEEIKCPNCGRDLHHQIVEAK